MSSLGSFAQTTTVTGTVKDANGNLYANGTVSAFLILGTGKPVPVGASLSSGPFPLTAAATFSVSLFSPATYTFTVCGTPVSIGPRGNPIPNSVCFGTAFIAVSGGSLDITTQINAVPPTILGPGGNPSGVLVNPVITPNPLNLDVDTHFKGPNPYVDITRFGARACDRNATPCAGGLTASMTSGSAVATISSASTFINGDGVVVYGAGSASGLTTPTGLAVTNVLATMGTGTGLTTASAAGSTTTCYKIIARTTGGGYTPASSEVCTTTGQAARGAVTDN